MEEPHQAVSEEGSSQTRDPTPKRKSQSQANHNPKRAKANSALPSSPKDSQGPEDHTLRRSLRIFLKQKERERQREEESKTQSQSTPKPTPASVRANSGRSRSRSQKKTSSTGGSPGVSPCQPSSVDLEISGHTSFRSRKRKRSPSPSPPLTVKLARKASSSSPRNNTIPRNQTASGKENPVASEIKGRGNRQKRNTIIRSTETVQQSSSESSRNKKSGQSEEDTGRSSGKARPAARRKGQKPEASSSSLREPESSTKKKQGKTCGEESQPQSSSTRKGKRSISAPSSTEESPSKRRQTDTGVESASKGSRRTKENTWEETDLAHPTSPKGKKARSKSKPSQNSSPTTSSGGKGRKKLSNKGKEGEPGSPSRKTKGKSQPQSSERSPSRSKGKGKAPLGPDSKNSAKGKRRGNSSKGKGKASSAVSTSCRKVPSSCVSLPPFVDFARLAMASEDDHSVPSDPSESDRHSPGGREGARPGRSRDQPTEGDPKAMDPFASMNEESRRLQSLLEARGLPPHLLGALGSKMHHLLQKSMTSSLSSTNHSRAQQLLASVESGDESLQLQSCIEMGQLLVMGNEDTLSGFPVKQAVPALINLLSMEHNFDMMLNASRALTYMMEALPRSTVVVVDAIPLLIERLQVIQCMDVAEQALSALALLSRRHSKAILQAGGLNACLLYLDFFSIAPQRSALSVAANCCQSVTEDDFSLVADALPVLTGRLQHQDKRSVESCCLCFSRLVDNFSHHTRILQNIATQGLLPNLQQLLVVSPPVISSATFVTVLRMLSTLCTAYPLLAVELLKLNMAETLRYLLVGSGEISLENIELVSRSPTEVYEILNLASEMMPPLPRDGIFEVEEILYIKRHAPTTVQWQWQDDDGAWRPYGRIENRIIEATHQVHEEECSIAVMGRAYIVDLGAMQQINEDTGNTRSVRRTTVDPQSGGENLKTAMKQEEDARAVILCAEPSLGSNFIQALFAVLYEVFNSMVGPAVRNKCLKTILRILYHSQAEVLSDILSNIAVSSHIATMLKSQDYRTIIGAMQMAEILMQKLPDIFAIYFHREGVMHRMKSLRDIPMTMLATPKQEVTTPTPPQPSISTIDSPHTPTTRKRLSDILRKGRRHFRRTLSRGRGDEELGARSQPLPLPLPHTPQGLEGKSPTLSVTSRLPGVTPTPSGASSSRSGEGGSSPGALTTKERLQEWIQKQSSSFLERWCAPVDQNPALEVVKRLMEASQQLGLQSPSCLDALKTICEILMDPGSNVSAFEFMHCELHTKLMSFLVSDVPEYSVALNTRLRQFLHMFMGLPEQEASLARWEPPQQVALLPLLQKLHGCVNQLEQFPVKVHDLPGRRGSQALRFFNTHQIKCLLERHPSAMGTSQWKGGPLRIDPLATVQTLERYMVMRGFGRPDYERKRLEDLDMSEDSEVEDPAFLNWQGPNTDRHYIEFLINDHVLPYGMTIFQAIKQHAMGGVFESEEEAMPLGRPEIWIRSHTIHYRIVASIGDLGRVGPSLGLSSSLPSTPLGENPPGGWRISWSTGGSLRRRTGSAKLSGSPPVRVTRSTSREKPPMASPMAAPFPKSILPVQQESRAETPREKEKVRLSPLHQTIQHIVSTEQAFEDPSLPAIKLVGVLYALNNHWTDLYPGLAGNPIVPLSEFFNSKLTAKAMRQLQDPLNVMTGNFPLWLKGLAKCYKFLFPFECRQMLFYLTTFDRDRAISRLQEHQPELAVDDSSQTVAPRLDKKKRCVSRDGLLEQAEKVMADLASSRALLEIHYQDEVGTGLGPTLEFYTLVSRDLQRTDLMMWRGDPCPMPGAPQGASSMPQYVHSPVGLFPAPLGPSTRFSIVEEVCGKFRFLGKFMAKAIMDSRMLDLPLSDAFYKWALGLEGTFTAQDLQHVDPVVANSFAQLAAVAVRKHALESDPLLSGKALAIAVESLRVEGGGNIEDLDLDFTLPGYPDIELKPGGKELPVTIHNLDDYLKLVVDWILVRGVARQIEAFKDGFNSVFPLSSLNVFYPSEMDMLLCGAHHQKWDMKELMECCRPDHGYSHDSRAVQFLFEVLSTYDNAEQRQFVQFVTGSSRLPVGGFKALNPPLTIVRKTVESPQNPDVFLPSVMTCVNYLKLPDYSTADVMRERLSFALREGRHSFHLS